METLLQDVRYGLRMIWKNPGFTFVAVMALALGIGANTAIFSVVNAVVLRPLPYRDSNNLVVIWGNLNRPGLEEIVQSAPEYVDLRARNRAFDEVAAYDTQGFNLTGLDEPERVQGAVVTSSLFPLLGIEPERGRAFSAEEDQPGHEQVVILSHGLWQRRFGSDTNLVGKTITLDGKSVNVVGIMPAGFNFPDNTIEVWKPVAFDADLLSENNRGSHFLTVIGRLKPGVTLEQAQADVSSVARGITQEHSGNYPNGFGATVKTLHEQTVGDVRTALFVLLVAVGFVLLIACANVANLLLARATARQKEVAIRTALGASRLRVIRQLLTESVLLSLMGGALGLLFAMWGVDVLVALGPASIPRLDEIGLDARVFAFTAIVSVLTGLLFGLAPALQASRTDLNESLKEGGRSTGEGRARVRGVLVVSEFALALLLLTGAGLMIRSFARLREVNPGFRPENLLTMRIVLPQSKYTTFQKGQTFFQELFERLKNQRGVKSVGAINQIPFGGGGGDRSFFIEGRPVPENQSAPDEQLRFVSADYFGTMGISVIKGREFSDRDVPDATRVAIVNDALARKYWPNESPVGKRIAFGRDAKNWWEIVGVVANVRYKGLDAQEKPQLYVPFLQPLFEDSKVGSMYLVVRTDSDPAGMTATVRHEVAAIDRDQPISDIKSMDERIGASLSERRFDMLLLGLFAFVALVLAGVGIYGIMAYSVTQRTHEIGIRMALGAQPRDVLKLILGRGMILALVGVCLGLVSALALTRLMASLLFNVSATDPLTFAGVSMMLTTVALLACLLPARRAMRVDPMVALRYE